MIFITTGAEPLEAMMPSGVQTEVKTYQMFINGEWVASKSAKTFPVSSQNESLKSSGSGGGLLVVCS